MSNVYHYYTTRYFHNIHIYTFQFVNSRKKLMKVESLKLLLLGSKEMHRSNAENLIFQKVSA